MKKLLAASFFVLTLILTYQLFSHFSTGNPGAVLALIAGIPNTTWIGLIVLTGCFYALDWVRFRSLLRVLGYRLGPVKGIQLTCVSYFVTCLTPSAELHTPAMVFMLARERVPVPQALAASITKSIYMTLWICLVSYCALFFDRSVALPDGLRQSLPFLTLPLLGIALLLALIALFPKPLCGWATQKSVAIGSASLLGKILHGIAQSAESVSRIGRSGNIQHWICHLASIAFLMTYVAIGWILARYFGFPISFLHAVTIFSTSLMVAYLAPVPGAIGVTEFATTYMLDPGFSPEGITVSLLLRILCWYLVTAPGGLILANAFRKGDGTWRLPAVF